MAYTPPASDAVNLDFKEAYTPPASDAVNLSIPLIGDQNIDVPSFENTSALESDALWFVPLIALEGASELEAPGVLLQVSVAPFESNTDFFATTTRRIPLLNLEQVTDFGPGFIAEVPENTDVVGAWPFENITRLDTPDIAHIIGAEFNQDTGFSTPVIIANDFAGIVAPDFETISQLVVDIMPGLTVFDFENTGQLEILAISQAPAGDQYTVCPDFVQNSDLENPLFLAGLPLPDFEQGTALVVESIFNGIVVGPVTFVNTSDLNATPYPGIYLSDFNSHQILESDIMPGISLPNFEQDTDLSVEIQIGAFLEIPEFDSRITIDVGISASIQLPEFEQNSALDGFDISEFIAPPEFNINGELVVEKISVFTIENAQIRYILTITGAADGLDDVEIPFVSFQARRRSGAGTYLQAVVPSTDYIDQITDRANGTMRITQAYVLGDEVVRGKHIIETGMDQVNPYQGATGDTLVLIGYKTTTYTPKTVVLSNATYRAQVDGKLSYRLPTPDLFLDPGDLVVIGEDEFTLGVMSYTVSGSFQQIDLTEA